MNQEFTFCTWKKNLENVCIFFSVLSAVVLLIVWALADTIAARNISIALGLLTSSIWILLARPKITRSDLIVPALLMGVPIWLWIIYFFWSIDPVSQYKEMTGTWFRVILLIIFGFNLGLMISRNSKLAIWIWLALASLPVVGLVMYLYEVYNLNIWFKPGYTGFFKTKSAGVYFLIWPCLLAYAGIHKALIDLKNKFFSLKDLASFWFSVTLALICMAMFYATHALTGFVVSGLFFIVLLFFFVVHVFRFDKVTLKNKSIIIVTISALIVLAVGVHWKYDQESQKRLTNIAADVLTSINIQKSEFWKYIPTSSGNLPAYDISNDGLPVNQSTYERVSWLVKGAQLVVMHPLGNGDTHLSFGRYMRNEYPDSRAEKTHSGWVDFALGAGIPSLLLIWGAIYFIVSSALRTQKEGLAKSLPLNTLWLISGVWILWWPGELSYREFFEHLIFMISFLAASISTTKMISKI